MPPSFFQGDDYIKLLNEEIIRQIRVRAEQGEEIFYIYAEDGFGFTSVAKEQSFYINKERKLVSNYYLKCRENKIKVANPFIWCYSCMDNKVIY